MKKLSFYNALCIILVAAFGLLIIINPALCKQGALFGITLCARVVIPSLFPFTTVVIFIMQSGVANNLEFLSPITRKLFKMPAELFFYVLLSFIGGYPIGAKLINEMVENGSIDKKSGQTMMLYCVNAGPAFIVSAVGSAVLNSKAIGYVLLFSHTLASLTIMIAVNGFGKNFIFQKKSKKNLSPGDNFVISVAEASSTLVKICSFVILFSSVNGYLKPMINKSVIIKPLICLLEITNSVTLTNNVFIISGMLGLGGICVWFQIFSVGNKIGIKPLKFILFRIIHGALSVLITKIVLIITKIKVPTVTNNISTKIFYSTPCISVSVLVMTVIFIISISTKKYLEKPLGNIV